MILPIALVRPPMLILLSAEGGRTILRPNVSITSVMLSLVIGILIAALVLPARNVALTGLEV